MIRMNNPVEINFDYLYAFCRKHNIKTTTIGPAIGRDTAYISSCRKTGKMDDAYVRLICLTYEMDYKELTSSDEDEETDNSGNKVTDKNLYEVLTKLAERIAVLEKKVEAKEIILTEREQIVLLLQQMLKFGSCEESLFKSKAKGYGFNKELIDFAIESLNLNRDVSGGKVWLEKKK